MIGGMLWMVVVLAAQPAAAQQTIKGNVVNAQTGNPVEGANVSYDNNRGTITDANGLFRIPCRNNVQIRVSYVGYQTARKVIRNCSTPVKILLKPQIYSLGDITVEEQLYIEEATSVGILELAELNRQSGLRLKSALNTVPGVEMQTRSPFGGQRITYPRVLSQCRK